MFRRDERERIRIFQEFAPYQRMAIDLEVDTRFQAQQTELHLANRHLLTSNDRLQLSAAHLHVARDRVVLANCLASAITENPIEPNAPQDRLPTVVEFVTSLYQTGKDAIETAEHIHETQGFQASHHDISRFKNTSSINTWPDADSISLNFLRGALQAHDTILGHLYFHYEAALNPMLPNNFKNTLRQNIESLLKKIETNRRAIERVAETGLEHVTSPSLQREIYDDLQSCYAHLAEIEVWLAMPRLQDQNFTLREPYDETAREKKPFDPSILGTPAVQATVAPPRPHRPFNPSALDQAPSSSSATPSRPFSPDTLTPAPSTAPHPSRPFTPDSLAPPARAERKFDPSILDLPARSDEQE